jgi:hypothetical protein
VTPRPVCFLLVLFAAVVLLGCASTARVQRDLTEQMLRGDYSAALQLVEREKDRSFRGKNQLLYFLEKGMLLQIEGRYVESNAAFEQAKRIGDALYTTSLSGVGLSMMTNDYALAYAGENFERTLVHLFSAVNYEMLGDLESALVEARQVEDYLRKLQVDAGSGNSYREDAFARYLSALLYEAGGEYGSSLVDYKKAIAGYAVYADEFALQPPPSLYENAERVAARLGRWAQDDLRALGSPGKVRTIPEGEGELIILHYNGLSPVKGQTKVAIPFSEAWLLVAAIQATADERAREDINRATAFVGALEGVDVISVAFPKYVDRPYRIARMEPLVAKATRITGPELVEDIGAIAEKDLEDRKALIYTKSVARAAIKYAIQKGVEAAARESGDQQALLVAGTQLLGGLARYASEQADKRVWSTLPDQIWMSSMVLPAGVHVLEVDFVTAQSVPVESRTIPNVEVSPGQRRFVILRTVK